MKNQIPPLRKVSPAGDLYARRPAIETLIGHCCEMPFEALIERAGIKDRRHPDYLPSEVLVHYLRATRSDNTDRRFEKLYDIVIARLVRNLRPAVHGDKESAWQSELQERVTERFVIRLMKDRSEYREALDIFEVAFDRAARALKVDMLRIMGRRVPPTASLEDEDSGEIREDIELALQALNPLAKPMELQMTYRIQLRRAIDSLPDNERRVIDMIFAGIPAESDDPNTPSIARILNCHPKTVRNRRDNAINKLKKLLGEA